MRIDRVSSGFAALLLASIGVPGTASAQGHDLRAAVHYQLLRVPGTTFTAGMNGEISTVLRSPLVLVSGIGWTSKHTEVAEVSAAARVIDFGAGLRLMSARSPFRPFVEVSAGGVNLTVHGTIGAASGGGSKTWFQLEPGAGVLLDVGAKVAVAASVHVRRVFLDRAAFESSAENQFEALAGVSVQLFD